MELKDIFNSKAKKAKEVEGKYQAELLDNDTVKALIELLPPKECAMLFNSQFSSKREAREAILKEAAQIDPQVKLDFLKGVKGFADYIKSPLYAIDKDECSARLKLAKDLLQDLSQMVQKRVFDPKKDSAVAVQGEQALAAEVMNMGISTAKLVMPNQDQQGRLEALASARKGAFWLMLDTLARHPEKIKIYSVLRKKGKDFLHSNKTVSNTQQTAEK